MLLLYINFMLKLLQTLLFTSCKIKILIRDWIFLCFTLLCQGTEPKTNYWSIQRNLHFPSLKNCSDFVTEKANDTNKWRACICIFNFPVGLTEENVADSSVLFHSQQNVLFSNNDIIHQSSTSPFSNHNILFLRNQT